MTGTQRIDRNGTHSYLLDGEPVQGVTTILKKGLPKAALVGWAAREVARFVAGNLATLQALQPDEVFDLCKGAPYRDRDRAADRGTEVHRLAQLIAAGGPAEVPQELAGHVAAYQKFREVWQPCDEVIERPIFSRQWRYAGTFDHWSRLPHLGRTLLDIKTNRSGPFGETALQLSAYAHADLMLSEDGQEDPIPPIDSYAVLWLRSDGYSLYPYAITERDWKTFLYVRQVAWWLDNRSETVKQEPLYWPPSTNGERTCELQPAAELQATPGAAEAQAQ